MNNFEIYIIFKSRTKGNDYPVAIVGIVNSQTKTLLCTWKDSPRPIEPLGLHQGRHLGLSGRLNDLLYVLLDIVFILCLELYRGFGGNSTVVLLELVAAVFSLERSHYIPHTFIFAEEALVLATALNGGASANEDGHLFEDLASAA